MSHIRGAELVSELVAAGVPATADARGAHPPVVLVPPPARVYDLNGSHSLLWVLFALVPPPGTADSWAKLDELVDGVAAVLDVERAEPASYHIPGGAEPCPAYRITLNPEGA